MAHLSRDYLEIVKQLFSEKSEDTEEKHDKLQEWIENVRKQIQDECLNIRRTSELYKFTCLLRELVLSHRWLNVVQILSTLALGVNNAEDIVHHLGFEVFLQEPSTSFVLFKKLHDQLKVLSHFDSSQIVMDYVLFLLSKQHFDNMIDSKTGVRTGRVALDQKKQNYLKTTYRAYNGLVHYIEWCKLRLKLEQSMEENVHQDDLFGVSSQVESKIADKEQLKVHKERACQCFEVCQENKGVWDIFITKHIKILEYHNEYDEAEHLLEDYVKKNPDNPYILNLCYKFICNHKSEDSTKKVELLKQLCERVPFGECVLDLYIVYKQMKQDCEHTLPLLFSLLDYPQWKNSVQIWKLLAEELEDLRSKNNDIFAKSWLPRKTWWIPYHFKLEKDTEADLVGWKAATAVYLIGPGAEFTKDVLASGVLNEEHKIIVEEAIENSMNHD